MKYRKLRIAWSLMLGITAVLPILLWVRSYSWFDSWNRGGHRFTSYHGILYIDEDFGITGINPRSWQYHLDGDSGYVLFELGKAAVPTPKRIGWILPYWLLLIVSVIPCGIPWLPWWSKRFSLRTLLIATTLVALLLALFVWLR